jgi:hypothetical protein
MLYLVFAIGLFWLVSAVIFAGQMRHGRFAAVKALHRDLAPGASARAWRAKNLALGLIGTLWIASALADAIGPLRGAAGNDSLLAAALAVLAAVAIFVEQLAMPLVSPRHWQSYSGVVVGALLAWLALHAGAGAIAKTGASPAAGASASVVASADAGARALAAYGYAALAHGHALVGAALFLSALFTGGLAFIALVLVPSWRGLDGAHYRAHFGVILARADRVMPRLARAIAVCVAAAIAARVLAGAAVTAPLWIAAAALALILILSQAINVPINRRLAPEAPRLDAGELIRLRRRWARGHQLRTGAALVLLGALVTGLVR